MHATASKLGLRNAAVSDFLSKGIVPGCFQRVIAKALKYENYIYAIISPFNLCDNSELLDS